MPDYSKIGMFDRIAVLIIQLFLWLLMLFCLFLWDNLSPLDSLHSFRASIGGIVFIVVTAILVIY